MLSKILTTAALVGLATTAATPSNPSRNFQLLQARQAAEAPKLAESGIVLLHTEPMPSGSFIEIYGSTNNRTSTPTASQEYQFAVQAPVYCGDERIKCGYNDAPGEDVTKQLIETLYANDEWTPWMPRSYCVYGNGSRACASWYVPYQARLNLSGG
ncbi:hypothetical protein B0T21DRAFT_285328 [Apiosordaria backusii]|uniref:Uncharacterized protein n=1 Tax=Apiosordaria backusii TaxID=314023 RepID=A0AA40BSL8_9PEZI|nr:hypothetical protein B0T21DRAFT_285328 [Apiosordaria backusii]